VVLRVRRRHGRPRRPEHDNLRAATHAADEAGCRPGSGSRPTASSNRPARRTVRMQGPHPTSRSLPLPSRPSSPARRASSPGE